ncbi:histone-lysine N-methyltransferase SETMAR-like [Euwallacea similis]|uniref:histone-lysine N-methyltransferase SETMAR-like n=1 Tax=Euwallacea similis TaxID=1736056 RepID=UPI00344D874B
MDETWLTSEIKEQSKQWTQRRESVSSTGKAMASFFWDVCGIIFIDQLPKGKTTNREFHQDNAPIHISVITMAKFNQLGFEPLPRPPYSPDLAPSDYFLFSNLKKWLGGKRFANNEEVESEVDVYFEIFETSYYEQCIEAIVHCWEKRVNLKGDYIGK